MKTNTKIAAKGSKTFGFRVIVRGNAGKKRVRRVRTVHAANEGAAVAAVEKQDPKVLSGLRNTYVAVLPPLNS